MAGPEPDPASLPARLARERRTLSAMIAMYCREHHGSQGGLCDGCASLEQYAHKRLSRCPFGAAKPTCARCPVHCYAPSQREQVRKVMAWAGPRMILHHPVLALLHVLDGWKRVPDRPPR